MHLEVIRFASLVFACQNETLHIPRVNRFDRGIYRCHAANNVYGSTEYDVMLEVNYKPQIRLARYKGAYGQVSLTT